MKKSGSKFAIISIIVTTVLSTLIGGYATLAARSADLAQIDQSLQKVVNHTKAMLNSWTSVVNENKNTSDFFNPMVPQMGRHNSHFPGAPTKGDYEKYGWLFGVK